MRKAQAWSLAEGDYPRFTRAMSYSRKNPNRLTNGNPWKIYVLNLLSPRWPGGWGHRFSMGFKERTCGNSGGQIKKTWNFQGCSEKTLVEFPWVLVFDLGIFTKAKGVSHNFCRIRRGESMFSNKSKNSRGFFKKSIYIFNPPLLSFSGIAQYSWKEAASALHIMSPTRLPRSDLPSLIYPRCTLHRHKSGKFAN